MNTLLVDTNIVSYLFKRDSRAALHRYTILPVDLEVCRAWAAVRLSRSARGQPISPQDAWIAATALRYRLPLVTHNPDDYQHIAGLTIITEA